MEVGDDEGRVKNRMNRSYLPVNIINMLKSLFCGILNLSSVG